MPNSSSYLRQKLLGHVLCGSPYTCPTTVFLSLASSVTSYGDQFFEIPTANGYARQIIQFGSYSNVLGQGKVVNSNLVDFTVANTTWPPVGFWGVHDAVSGGNLLVWGTLSSTISITGGQFPEVAVNSVAVLMD